MIFVDTNYFLRFLLKDVSKQHQKAKRLFEEAALGKVKLFTSLIVFFEIYWVLSSFYGKKKKELISILQNILKMSFIQIEQRERLQKAVIIFKKENFDLEDAFNLVYAKNKKATVFQTFDRKLSRRFKGL